MKLTHQTGTATLVQMVVMLLLNFATAIQSSVSSCVNKDGCVSGIVINSLFLIVLAVWLMFLAAVGYMAESKRSRRFALALIAGESLVAIVTLFNIRHFPNILGLITSLIDFTLAIWVVTLAWRLRKVKTATIAAPRGQRPRKRIKA